MVKRPEEFLKLPYARVLIPDEKGTFSAQILEFPGCFSQGNTPDEAFQNLENAASAWIEAALLQQQDIPPPSACCGYTGKVALRLPKSIHKKAMELAQRDGTSLNQYLITAIATRIGAEDLYARLVERLDARGPGLTSAGGSKRSRTQSRKQSLEARDAAVASGPK